MSQAMIARTNDAAINATSNGSFVASRVFFRVAAIIS